MKNPNIFFRRTLVLALGASVISLLAKAGEPVVPPEMNQPHTHIVELKQNAVMRMGDTVTLKGTTFSAKLVGFHEPLCPGPRPGCAGQSAIPEFQLSDGTTTCEPDPKSRACLRKLGYTLAADPVKDRAAVVVRIKNRRIKTTH